MNNTIQTSQKDPLKIVLCGPPHSGKSVFTQVLTNLLNKDRFAPIEAAPDGEGNTGRSSKANQQVVKQVRKKGKFSSDFIDQVCENIDNIKTDIAFIDVGGVISPENRKIFEHSSHVVILSSNPDVNAGRIALTQETGCQLLAVLDSSLSGEDELYPDQGDGVLRGRISKLERDNIPYDSSIAKVLADKLINMAPYTMAGIEDADADLLGYEEYRKIKEWTTAELYSLLDANRALHGRKQSLNLRGNVSNGATPYYVLSCDQRQDVSYYDPKTRQGYVQLPRLQVSEGDGNTLDWNITHHDHHVVVQFSIPGYALSVDQLGDIILPHLGDVGSKGVIISGKGPRRLTGTVIKNYHEQTECTRIATTNMRLTNPNIQIEGKSWNEISQLGQLPAVIVGSRDEKLFPVGTVVPYDPS